jgi:hypothetical protein
MSDPKFPPESPIPYSVRKEQLLTCKFLSIRKAVTEQYKNPDGTALMSYHETLSDRDMVRNKVLEYELAQGWITDDRSNAQVIAHPASPQIGATVPTNGTHPGPAVQAPISMQQFQPQPVASPAQAIAAAQTPIPPPQEPPAAPPTTGLKRPAPKGLQSAVAPPPLAAPMSQAAPAVPVQPAQVPVAPPAPPPGAVVLSAPVAPQPAQQAAIPNDLVSKIDSIGKGLSMVSEELDRQGKDFKTMVGNLSTQTSETNKSLMSLATQFVDLKKSVEILTAAVHHIYLSTGTLGQSAGQEGTTLPGFKTYISKYLPQ